MLDQFTANELHQAINGAGLGLWSWDINADKICWSSLLGEIYGVDPENFPSNITELSALLPLSVGGNLQEQLINATDQKSGNFEFEHPITRPEGQSGWIRNTGRVIFDSRQRPTHLSAAVIDITKQKQTELSLQIQEEHFRRLCEITSDYIFEVDTTTRPFVPNIVAGAYERIIGYSMAELKERGGWTSIMNPEDLKNSQEVYKQLETGVPTVHEYRITNRLGETRWLRDYSYPVMKDGKLVKLVGGVKDISETKTLQDQLVQAQKHEAMAQLVGAVAHDFNNLLFVVSATTEVITLDADDLEELKADILLACDRAAELSRSLLAFTGKELPQARTIRLSDAINDSRGLLNRAVGKMINIGFAFAHDINDKVNIDPGQLQLVLLNMAANARAAISDKGEILISVAAVDPNTIDLPQMHIKNTVALTVTDSGCGITAEILHRIFDPFFTTKPVGEGSGMGLATCWQIIDRVGGTIQVKSTDALGTSFTIYLPTVDTDAHEVPVPARRFSWGGKERILVVQNDPDVQRITVRTLQSYGYKTTAVACAVTAKQAIPEGNYDLLIVDIRLPDDDGFSLANGLSDTDHNPPVLLVSGYINDDIRTKIRIGGHNVLASPFSSAELARSVRATLTV